MPHNWTWIGAVRFFHMPRWTCLFPVLGQVRRGMHRSWTDRECVHSLGRVHWDIVKKWTVGAVSGFGAVSTGPCRRGGHCVWACACADPGIAPKKRKWGCKYAISKYMCMYAMPGECVGLHYCAFIVFLCAFALFLLLGVQFLGYWGGTLYCPLLRRAGPFSWTGLIPYFCH